MVRQRVTRLANPRGRKRNGKRVTQSVRNRKGQFVKASKVRQRAKSTKRRTRRANPVLITLGAINPRPTKRRKTKVARRRRRNSSAPVRRRRRRANPVAAAPVRRRRRSVVRRRRRNSVTAVRHTRRRNRVTRRHRRRNPSFAGGVGMVEKGFGVLIGVTAAKMIPTFLPASFISSPIMRILATGASAYLASMLVGKVRANIQDAVLLGGFAQTVSVALNSFLPSIGSQIGLNGYRAGMGDFVAGSFAVPQNPIVFPAPPMPAQARIPMNGLARAFGSAF